MKHKYKTGQQLFFMEHDLILISELSYGKVEIIELISGHNNPLYKIKCLDIDYNLQAFENELFENILDMIKRIEEKYVEEKTELQNHLSKLKSNKYEFINDIIEDNQQKYDKELRIKKNK